MQTYFWVTCLVQEQEKLLPSEIPWRPYPEYQTSQKIYNVILFSHVGILFHMCTLSHAHTHFSCFSLVTAETVDVILMLSTPVHVCDVACCYTEWIVVALDLCSSISGHASVVGDEGQAFRHRAFLQGKHCWSMALWPCCCDVAHFSFWWLQLIGWSFCHFWGDRWGGVDYSATFGGGGGAEEKLSSVPQ